jgi:hypothetical protein
VSESPAIGYAPPGERWSRLYLGSEFCQALLPGAAGLSARLARVPADVALTLVTPPVTDAGMTRVEALLGALASWLDRARGDASGAEVVVNDWGVLRLLRNRPRFTPALGRLLTRMLRDPRIPSSAGDAPGAAAPVALRAVRQSTVTSPPFRALLDTLGVRRVELDPVVQGLDMDFDALGLAPTLHAPFGYVTTGRVCLFAALGQPAARRFDVGHGCQHECRTYDATMRDAAAPAGAASAALYTAGNTVFQRHARATVERALRATTARGQRFVVREAPFDEHAWATEDAGVARRWLEEHTQ